MRSARFVCLLLLPVFLPTGTAYAEQTGNQLLVFCTSVENNEATFSNGYCGGFIDGIADLLSVVPKSKLCVPNGATKGQGWRIVAKYLREHPEQLHEQAYVLVGRALIQAFPCN